MYISKREDEPSLSTDTQIAIGVVVPTLLLIGGLLLFIWRTERGRRNKREEVPIIKRPARPRINSYLHHLHSGTHKIVCESQSVRSEVIDSVRSRPAGLKGMHELEDTGKHEFPERNGRNTPTTSFRPPRNDSAINATSDEDESHDHMPAGELDTFDPNYRPSRVPEHRFSNTFREYLPRTSSYGYRRTPRDISKREARIASSRYSRESREARTSSDDASSTNLSPEDIEERITTEAAVAARFARSPSRSPPALPTLAIPSPSPDIKFPVPPITAHLPLRESAHSSINTNATTDGSDVEEILSPAVSDISRPPTTHHRGGGVSPTMIVSPTSDAGLGGRMSLMPPSSDQRAGERERESVRVSGEAGGGEMENVGWGKRVSEQGVAESTWRLEGELF